MSEIDFTIKYKPKNFSEILLPEDIGKTLDFCRSDSFPFPYLLTGPTGVGKTLVATNLREETHFLNCLDGCSEEDIYKLERSISAITFSGLRRLVILDDVDHLLPKYQLKLIDILDRFSTANDFIMTAGEPFRIKPALLSRVQIIDFGFSESRSYRNGLVDLLLKIAYLEDYKTLNKIEAQKIVKNSYPDIRKMLRQLQSHLIQQTRQ